MNKIFTLLLGLVLLLSLTYCKKTTADATCFDGIKNQNETGVDCGGACTPCATCFDGIKNQNETGIDCGGSCASCSVELPFVDTLQGFYIVSDTFYDWNPPTSSYMIYPQPTDTIQVTQTGDSTIQIDGSGDLKFYSSTQSGNSFTYTFRYGFLPSRYMAATFISPDSIYFSTGQHFSSGEEYEVKQGKRIH